MRKAFLLLFITIGMASCGNEDQTTFTETELQQSLASRAYALGYDTPDDYTAAARQLCANGTHINCDICDNGLHTPCVDCNHEGMHKNGKHQDYGNHYGWEKGKHYGWENCPNNGNGNGKGNGNHGNK